jgi:hypothetical protein
MATRMQQRRGTAAQWTAANPILAAGEIGFETDTSKFKMGNGSSAWSALTYFANAAELAAIVDAAPETLNTLNELAAALGDDPAFFTNIAESIADSIDLHNGTTNVHGIANTALLATTANVATAQTAAETFAGNAVTTHNADISDVHGIANTADLATKNYTDSAIGTHQADSTEVHGIANTADLATKNYAETYADSAIADHQADSTEVHGIEDTALLATKSYADTAVQTHENDVENIHGIANTADLATKNYADTAVSTHSDDTLGVHGIADTSALATKTYADTSVSTHQAVTTDVHGISNTANLAYVIDITDHNSETLDVHGISNTGNLAYLSDLTDHNNDTLDVHGIANTALLATQAYVDTAVGNSAVDQSALAGVGLDYNSATDAFDIDSTVATTTYVGTEIGTHNSDTTSVHGIADTEALATKVYADAAVTTHTADTTAVHGIADTSLLALKSEVAAVTATTLGLGNVTNTSDTAKPVSTAQASAIATAKAEAIADATSQVNALLTGAPAALNTLDELAAALGDDANFASSVTTSLGLKVDSLTPISQKTASYTLSSLTERDDLIEMGSATGVTLTIPTDATLDFPIGTSIDILQTGAGQVTIAPVSGTVTVNATPGLKLRTTWSSCTLLKRAANTWVVFGDLTA